MINFHQRALANKRKKRIKTVFYFDTVNFTKSETWSKLIHRGNGTVTNRKISVQSSQFGHKTNENELKVGADE